MPLTEQQAIEKARRFVQTIRRDLAYPVSDKPSAKLLSQGRAVWAVDFDYAPPPHLLVDPSAIRILVDDVTGEAAVWRPR
jgi:hypothetical protein